MKELLVLIYKVIDAAQTKEKLHEEISNLILAKIQESNKGEIGKLWM